MKHVLALLILVLFFWSCRNKSVDPETIEERFEYSFENNFAGWISKSTDVDNPPAAWSIQRSEEHSSEGSWSLRMSLVNMTDAGKIWIERSFLVKPDRKYRVTVEYAFATKDYGTINLWRLIAGVGQKPAFTRDDLAYQGDTGNGAMSDVGFRWLEKAHEFSVTSGAEGNLYVDIGVWGTWETPRTYYFDRIVITIAEAR